MRQFQMQTHGDNGVVTVSIPTPSCEADMDEMEASILHQLKIVRRQMRRRDPEFHPLAAERYARDAPND